MTKKKPKKKKTLPNNVNEEEFLIVLENISKRLGNKFKFGYHTFEDMKQQAAIFALEGLKRYDSSRPLENFLWTHVRNRLFNYKRDHYQRPDVPCNTCPFFDKHRVKTQSQCTEFSNRNDCELYNAWYTRNNAKKNIMKPVDIENTPSPSKTLDVEDSSTWAPINLTSGSVKLIIRKVGETDLTATITMSLTDASNGVATCVFPSGTWTAAGTYEGEVEFTNSSSKVQTVQDLIKFVVRDDFN